MSADLNQNTGSTYFESKPNSNVKSALPAQVDALKRNSPQLNQHEDLRRRAR